MVLGASSSALDIMKENLEMVFTMEKEKKSMGVS
jgi:hypothetical protein